MEKKIKNLGIIGGGDLAEQLLNMIAQSEVEVRSIVYFDDIRFERLENDSYRFEEYLDDKFSDYHFIVCLGYKHLELKMEIIERLKAASRKLFTFIHPSAHIDKTAKIGKGVIIYPMCNVDYKVNIEDGSVLNNSVVVSHESVAGKSSFLSSGVAVAGKVKIGRGTFVGTGSSISSIIEIGENVRIGIGTVITANIENNISVIGNPMRKLNKKLNLI